MASQTYNFTGLVLRRTNLGESDVICSLLSTEGILIQVVAKGARKPKSTLSSRLELFSIVEVFVAKGRSLDIVKEAKLVQSFDKLRQNYDAVVIGSPILEMLRKSTQAAIENPRLFDMTKACLEYLEKSSAHQALYLLDAYFFKALAFLGFRPSFTTCIGCGSSIEDTGLVAFSSLEGGAVCSQCFYEYETTSLSYSVLVWSQALMMSTFSEIMELEYYPEIAKDCLRLAQQLFGDHLGIRLKSLSYLFTQISFE